VRAVLIAVAAGILAVTVYYGVFLKGSLPNPSMLHGIKNDIFLHFVAFAALTIPVWILWKGRITIVALVCCAAAIEAVQIFQPNRTAALDDFAASFAGVIFSVTLVIISERGIRKFKI